MFAMLSRAFLLGLATAPFCAAACAPVFLPVVLSREKARFGCAGGGARGVSARPAGRLRRSGAGRRLDRRRGRREDAALGDARRAGAARRGAAALRGLRDDAGERLLPRGEAMGPRRHISAAAGLPHGREHLPAVRHGHGRRPAGRRRVQRPGVLRRVLLRDEPGFAAAAGSGAGKFPSGRPVARTHGLRRRRVHFPLRGGVVYRAGGEAAGRSPRHQTGTRAASATAARSAGVPRGAEARAALRRLDRLAGGRHRRSLQRPGA